MHPHVSSTYRATSIEGTIPADVTDDARRQGRQFRAEWSASRHGPHEPHPRQRLILRLRQVTVSRTVSMVDPIYCTYRATRMSLAPSRQTHRTMQDGRGGISVPSESNQCQTADPMSHTPARNNRKLFPAKSTYHHANSMVDPRVLSTRGYSVAEVSERLSVSVHSLYKWVKSFQSCTATEVRALCLQSCSFVLPHTTYTRYRWKRLWMLQ
jgi:hypothetical protein